MNRVDYSLFGWNWLDWETYEPGLMDDQGRFISVYRLFENTPASLFLYLAEME